RSGSCSSGVSCRKRETERRNGRTYLSFHLFPNDTQLQRKWVKAIRGHQGACFKVCSWHFTPEDYDEQHSSTSSSHLKRGSYFCYSSE
uniref:THAP-type domain-containing protein n=1 Tax=Seriola dumerili TaxID=41447 RepID=A0A3B4VHS9_SERDU